MIAAARHRGRYGTRYALLVTLAYAQRTLRGGLKLAGDSQATRALYILARGLPRYSPCNSAIQSEKPPNHGRAANVRSSVASLLVDCAGPARCGTHQRYGRLPKEERVFT
jgi:hypothetical protein